MDWRQLTAGGFQLTIRRTDSRTAASWIASEHEVVVLPTPPLPPGARQYATINSSQLDSPQKIHLSDFWSRMFCSVGSRASRSSAMLCAVCSACVVLKQSKDYECCDRRRGDGLWREHGTGSRPWLGAPGTHWHNNRSRVPPRVCLWGSGPSLCTGLGLLELSFTACLLFSEERRVWRCIWTQYARRGTPRIDMIQRTGRRWQREALRPAWHTYIVRQSAALLVLLRYHLARAPATPLNRSSGWCLSLRSGLGLLDRSLHGTGHVSPDSKEPRGAVVSGSKWTSYPPPDNQQHRHVDVAVDQLSPLRGRPAQLVGEGKEREDDAGGGGQFGW